MNLAAIVSLAVRNTMDSYPAPQAAPQDRGKRLPIAAPAKFDGTFSTFRDWWEELHQYFQVNRPCFPDDETKIICAGSYMKGEAKVWFLARLRTAKASHLNDDWKSFSSAVEDRFIDLAEVDKDHEKLLDLRYQGCIQTFLANFGGLNARIGMTGESLRRTLRIAITKEIHNSIYTRYGSIPKNDVDLILAIREAGVAVEEGARSAALSKGTTHGCSDKPENKSSPATQTTGKDAAPRKEPAKASGGQKGAKPKESKPQPKE